MEQQNGIVSIVTRLQTGLSREELFLFFKMFRLALGPTEFAVKGVLVPLPPV
jgi:hypothetical protein